jgi:hypothetical protein
MYNSSENIEKLIATLPQEIQTSFTNISETVTIRKNEYLLREGELCKHLHRGLCPHLEYIHI